MKTIKMLAACAIAATAVACSGNTQKNANVDAEYPSKGLCDSVSYYIGFNYGYFIKQNGFEMNDLDMNIIKKGMNDFLNAKNPQDTAAFQLDPNDMNKAMQTYMVKKSEYEAAVNKIEGENWLAANKEKSGVVVTESGLQYKIISEGNEIKPTIDDTVRASYVGTYIDGEEFDNSQGNAIEFALGRVIKGWAEGMQLIGEGGEIELYIPAELGYGERAYGPIRPNATLIFNVKLEKVIKAEPAAEEVAE